MQQLNKNIQNKPVLTRVAYLFLARLMLSANSSRAVKTRSLSRNYNI